MARLDDLFEEAFRARGEEREALVAQLREWAQESIHWVAQEHFDLYGNHDRLRLAYVIAPKTPIRGEFITIAAHHGVSVVRDLWNESLNRGSSSGDRIMLGEFDDEEIEIAAFFHELGHCESHKRLGPDHVYMSTLSMEGMAWEVGFSIAADYGYAWNFYHPVKQWARQQLATYLEGDNAGELTRKYVETSPGVYSRAE